MPTDLSTHATQELLETLHDRYNNLSMIYKTRIWDEVAALVSCHRKQAIRLLTSVESCPGFGIEAGLLDRAFPQAIGGGIPISSRLPDQPD